MSGLSQRRCPNCGEKITIDTFYNEDKNGRYLSASMQTPVGGVCYGCDRRWKWSTEGIIEGYFPPNTKFFQEEDFIQTNNLLFIGIMEKEV